MIRYTPPPVLFLVLVVRFGGFNLKDKRPRNLGIAQILAYQLPIQGIASILHRVTGLFLFLSIPFLLYLLQQSFASPDSFSALKNALDNFLVKLVVWGILAAFVYHLLAGIKHLVMDFGHAETKTHSRIAAQTTLVLTCFIMAGLGVWLW